MTCTQMGGPCETMLSGETAEEIVANGTKHVTETHPEIAEKMNAMSAEEKATWMTDFQAKWDQTADM